LLERETRTGFHSTTHNWIPQNNIMISSGVARIFS
jgi:hypothetical protein